MITKYALIDKSERLNPISPYYNQRFTPKFSTPFCSLRVILIITHGRAKIAIFIERNHHIKNEGREDRVGDFKRVLLHLIGSRLYTFTWSHCELCHVKITFSSILLLVSWQLKSNVIEMTFFELQINQLLIEPGYRGYECTRKLKEQILKCEILNIRTMSFAS